MPFSFHPMVLNGVYCFIVDVLLIMFISLLYLSNGDWYFGDWLCRVNAWAQQFIFLKTITNLMLMAMERALGLKGNHLVTLKHFWILSGRLGVSAGNLSLSDCVELRVYAGVFVIIPICFAAPIFFTNFPVKVQNWENFRRITQSSL